MKRDNPSLRARGAIASLVAALGLTSVGGCTGGGNGTATESELGNELIATAKKARNRTEFRQLLDQKIKDNGEFVTEKPSGKTKKKGRQRSPRS